MYVDSIVAFGEAYIGRLHVDVQQFSQGSISLRYPAYCNTKSYLQGHDVTWGTRHFINISEIYFKNIVRWHTQVL